MNLILASFLFPLFLHEITLHLMLTVHHTSWNSFTILREGNITLITILMKNGKRMSLYDQWDGLHSRLKSWILKCHYYFLYYFKHLVIASFVNPWLEAFHLAQYWNKISVVFLFHPSVGFFLFPHVSLTLTFSSIGLIYLVHFRLPHLLLVMLSLLI